MVVSTCNRTAATLHTSMSVCMRQVADLALLEAATGRSYHNYLHLSGALSRPEDAEPMLCYLMTAQRAVALSI